MDDDQILRVGRFLRGIGRAAPLHSAEAFARLYDRTHLIVFRYIYGLSGRAREDAEDLAAETFARAWKARQRFHGGDEAALGWLLQIARPLVIDHYRRQAVRGVPDSLDEAGAAADAASPEAEALLGEQIQILWKLLHTLPLEQKELLVLRYLLGWRVTQIAGYVGLNENTVSVTIRRALTRLSRNWPSPGPEGAPLDV
jgi:RNA polymerase sigma-70 factor, ECF subfamily